MMTTGNDKPLRQHLVDLLTGGNAHADFNAAVKGLPVSMRGKRPKGAEHSPWEILEHMRIAQWDILEFSRDPAHTSPEWPAGYWPKTQAPPSASAWSKSLKTFQADLKAMCDLITDPSTNLYAPIPHGLYTPIPQGTGKTILREALLIADHNAYHLGELVLLRRLLGVWK
jgi:hypothetical protein